MTDRACISAFSKSSAVPGRMVIRACSRTMPTDATGRVVWNTRV
jgi:hypothetical protein